MNHENPFDVDLLEEQFERDAKDCEAWGWACALFLLMVLIAGLGMAVIAGVALSQLIA